MALAGHNIQVIDGEGDIVASASIKVQRETPGAPLVRLYSDRDGTVQISNPATTDANGHLQFFPESGGVFKITATKGAFNKVWRYVPIGTAQEADIEDLSGDISFNGFTPDEVVDTLAERDAFDGEAKGFSVLVRLNDASPAQVDPQLYFLTDPNTSPVTWSEGFPFPTESEESATAVNVGGNALAPHEGLVIKYASATTVDIDADALLLKDSDGNGIRLEDIDLTVDITASGANGLDAGVEANSTWYHLWAIYNPTTETVAGLLSADAGSPVPTSPADMAPTLPSGYTYKGYVGAVRNDGSGNFVAFYQAGNSATIKLQRVLNGGTATSYTEVDISQGVPPTAKVATMSIGAKTSSGTASVTTALAADGSGTTPTYGEAYAAANSTSQVYNNAEVIMSTAQQVMYFVVGANAVGDLWVNGYKF